jgi:hypothetical protein
MAVCVALFREQIIGLLLPIRIEVSPARPVMIAWAFTDSKDKRRKIDAKHYRLDVTCLERGPAKHVEVLVTQVGRNGVRLDHWSPMALGWADDVTQGKEPFRKVLSKGTTRICDFLMMLKPGEDTRYFYDELKKGVDHLSGFRFDEKACVKIMTAVDPNGMPNVLEPGMYHLELEVAASNVEPKSHCFEVIITQWIDGRGHAVSIRKI